MSHLCNDMTRLVDEIQASRAGRGRLIRDLNQWTGELKRAVAGMQTEFRSTRAATAKSQQQQLHGFLSGLKATVAGLRRELRDDLAGAHKAWGGAVPGRARRGARRFES